MAFFKDTGIATVWFMFAKKLQAELPPNFSKIVYDQYVSINGLGRIIIILSLFFSFNFYAYVYIKAALVELERERLHEENLNKRWSDLFTQASSFTNPYSFCLASQPQFTDFDETARPENLDFDQFIFKVFPNFANHFYVGVSGQNVLSIKKTLAQGTAVLHEIHELRIALAVPLFVLLEQKPNTSIFDNLLYLLWLPFDLDAKKRLLQYKQKELGEIVLELLLKKVIRASVEDFQKVFGQAFLFKEVGPRKFLFQNIQLLVSNIGFSFFYTRKH